MDMKFDVDPKDFADAVKRTVLGRSEMLDIEGAGSYVVVNNQKTLVPVDEATTKLSIKPHITKMTATYIEDEVGPETEYAPNIEYGRRDMPNYPIQPFIRPSATGRPMKETLLEMSREFGNIVVRLWR